MIGSKYIKSAISAIWMRKNAPVGSLRAARTLSSSTRGKREAFFNVGSHAAENVTGDEVTGEMLDSAMDLRNARPGEVITVPYELTFSHSLRDFWQAGFYSHDRINTSTRFARKLGMQDQVAPFSLMLFMTAAMSHADHAKIQVGFSNARYHWPAFANDSFTKRFTIKSLRSTSTGADSVFEIGCELINQRDIVVFSCDKTMLFPFSVPTSPVEVDTPKNNKEDAFLEHLIGQSEVLQQLGSQTLRSVRPGQLILHSQMRGLGFGHSMQLATLGRLTHERHFNIHKFNRENIYTPGGLVLALTCSLASRDLHEVLYEDLGECIFPAHLNPDDCVSSMTFVKALKEHVSGDIESMEVRTIGVKNAEVAVELVGRPVPKELLEGPLLKPASLDEVLKQKLPELRGKIVCVADRTIYRQAPKHVPFLL